MADPLRKCSWFPPLRCRAKALAERTPSSICLRGAFLAGALLAFGCGGSAEAKRGAETNEQETGGEHRETLAELALAFQPTDPTATSDEQDRRLDVQRSMRLRLLAAKDPSLGRAALAAFDASADEPPAVRVALLEVAAHNNAAEVAPRLEEVITVYDPALGYGVRGHAIAILVEVAPERALALLEPLAKESRHSATLPPQEEILRGWIAAARALGLDDARLQVVLAAVATDIFMDDTTRHRAVEELGRTSGVLGQRALEEVLVESSSNGYLRRKAAQALIQSLPAQEVCPILERVADREVDTNFLSFLASALDQNCP